MILQKGQSVENNRNKKKIKLFKVTMHLRQ
jgi:hypothetical protein